jgi:hypothetical protein
MNKAYKNDKKNKRLELKPIRKPGKVEKIWAYKMPKSKINTYSG